MPTPSVDVITGTVTNGPIKAGETFEWKCADCSGSVYATAGMMPTGHPWFTPNPSDTFTAPGGSATVTAEGVNDSPGWAYGSNVNTDGAKIKVSSSVRAEEKKAS